MRWRNFWAVHRIAYEIIMWLVSIKFAILGVFCLCVGFWTPWLFALAPLCIACCAIANPWIVRRYKRWRHR